MWGRIWIALVYLRPHLGCTGVGQTHLGPHLDCTCVGHLDIQHVPDGFAKKYMQPGQKLGFAILPIGLLLGCLEERRCVSGARGGAARTVRATAAAAVGPGGGRPNREGHRRRHWARAGDLLINHCPQPPGY